MAISEKIHTAGETLKKSPLKKYYGAALFLILGFCFSLGSALSGLHPFGAAFVAASDKKHRLFSAPGAVLGTLLYGLNAETVRYLAAIAFAAAAMLLADRFAVKEKPLYPVAAVLGCVGLTGTVLNVVNDAGIAEYVLTLAETVLGAGGAYFFYHALRSDVRRLRFRALPLSEVSCILITLTLLMMNLASLRVGIIAPAGAAAVLLILMAGRFLGERYALVLALSVGFVFSLEAPGAFYKVGALAFSAWLCSLLSALPDVGVAAAFLGCVAFFCIASEAEGALGFFLDSAIGALAFVLIPSGVYRRLEEAAQLPSAPTDGAARQSLVLKLKFAGAAMGAISESVRQVRERITERSRRENERDRASMTEEEYAAREFVLEKTNQIRTVAADQLFTIAELLGSLAEDFDETEIVHAAASARIRRLLGEYEIYPKSISAVEDGRGRMRVEILTDGNTAPLKNPALAGEVGKICGRYFGAGNITAFRDEALLSFYEKPAYRLDTGAAQYSADGEICGDTVKLTEDGRGNTVLIISDGMGIGARAALDGAMGAGLLSKLLHAGFGFDASLKIINSALLVKSDEESLATLDVASVDRFTGKCEIFKAGAPASYIIKDFRLHKCELSSMPAGILRGIEFAKRTAVLCPGDSIVLMSDGICDLGEAFLKDVLTSLGEMRAQESADYILKQALERSEHTRRDDMSVIVARLENN